MKLQCRARNYSFWPPRSSGTPSSTSDTRMEPSNTAAAARDSHARDICWGRKDRHRHLARTPREKPTFFSRPDSRIRRRPGMREMQLPKQQRGHGRREALGPAPRRVTGGAPRRLARVFPALPLDGLRVDFGKVRGLF